jgi:hypothetical protein
MKLSGLVPVGGLETEKPLYLSDPHGIIGVEKKGTQTCSTVLPAEKKKESTSTLRAAMSLRPMAWKSRLWAILTFLASFAKSREVLTSFQKQRNSERRRHELRRPVQSDV